MKRPLLRASALVATALLPLPLLTAQERKELGRMWTFEAVPTAWLQEAYDFTPTTQWLQHAQLASLRFGRGCSASFVSPKGLIMTNHHCARDNVAQVQGENDWVKDGFYAGSFEKEVKLPGLTVQQLVSMRDVTKEMQEGKTGSDILGEAKTAQPDLQHQVVALYQGGMYQLYSYKIWDDIRLVCAPHGQSAHYGGDPDNFCYPRWGLDFTFVRAYVDDKPADTSKHYFKWKTKGAGENELVFVTGNPGNTGRLQTLAQCEYLRDHVYPASVERAVQMLEQLNAQAQASPEQEKRLRTRILSVENSRKAFQGYLDGLRNPRIMAIKAKAESDLRAAVAQDPKLQEKYGDAWDKIAELQAQKVDLQGDREKGRELQKLEAEQNKRIGEACFAVYGTSIPPDATFTLRLSDGVVKGYAMNGTVAPYFTSLYGLFARHTEFGGVHPFDLPRIWLEREDKLDLRTPFNFVATCDIIGGNSGSPVIDRDLNVVGLVFDGNIEMLGNNYVFDDEVSRSVSVHPAIIIESLRKIYGAGKLADELEKNGARQQ